MAYQRTSLKNQRPASACNNVINTLGVFVYFLAIFYYRDHPHKDMVFVTIMCVAAYGLTIAALEVIFLRTPWRESTGLEYKNFQFSAERVMYKLLGLAACYMFVGLAYWQFDEYDKNGFDNYFRALEMVLPYVAILAIPYTVFMDGYSKEPEDTYYHLGVLLVTRKLGTSKKALGQLFMVWTVKGYFLALMFMYMVGDVDFLLKVDISNNRATFLELFFFMTRVLFMLDLLAAVAGYGLTLRILDSHIRSVEPTFVGWFACVMCYAPFNAVHFALFATYRNGHTAWTDWLAGHPYIMIVWGFFTLVAIAAYSLAGINFGIRFSNLTHRCVLTNGLYRYTKHPEYVFKNFYWWTTHVPFIAFSGSDTFIETCRWFVLMMIVNGVYFVRARTEEQHMSRDPVYVEYALWMNDHGLLAFVGRYIPYFRYKPPHDWEQQAYPYMGIK